jgi:hypothetical protein
MTRTWILGLLASCWTAPEDKPPPSNVGRAASFQITGHWSYVVRTNECNVGLGRGGVDFTPRGQDTYGEAGYVLWPDGSRIEWRGEMRPSHETTLSNSLDDTVESRWFIDRERDQLVVRWRQSNGCSGIGIATRPGRRDPSFEALSVCASCRSVSVGCVRANGDKVQSSCPALCCR